MRVAGQKRFFHVRLLVLIAVIGTVSLTAIPTRHLLEGSAQGRGHTPKPPGSPPQQRPPAPHHCSTCPPPSPRKIYAPAIELPEAGACEIVLNSRSPHPIDVTPTLYTMDGEQVIGEPVTLHPAEIRFVPIESLIPDRQKGRHHWGGIALSYTGGLLEVWAQIAFRGVGGKGSIDETFNLFEDQGSDTREAVWSMPKGSSAVIALGNSSDTPILTTAEFSDGAAEAVNIAPFATEFIRRRAREHEGSEANNDSVRLTTVGPAGSLRVAGFVIGGKEDSSIRFADTKKAVQPNLYATNLRLENTDPLLLIENTSDSGISARPQFFPATGDQGSAIELPEIILAPRQIVDVDLRPLTEAATTRTDLSSVSVQVLNSGAPGSLIGALYGTDKIKRLSYDVPLRDSGPIRSSTGSYPWRVDEDYTTIVNITNISVHSASFLVDIRYPTGHYFLQVKDVAANGTSTFDLRKLISEQKPDNQGNIIPLFTTGGQFHWSIFGSPPSSKFIGRSEVVSVSNHVSSSYSCPVCCPDSGPFGSIIPPDDDVPVGGFATVHTAGTVTDCNGNSTNIGWFEMDDFWVDNPSIMSYSPDSGASTVVEGLAAGQTVINGSYWSDQFTSDGWSMCFESRGEETASQLIGVKPTITGPNVVWWFNGADPGNANMPVSVQLTTASVSGGSYSWTATANANKISLQNATTNTVTITGAAKSGQAGDIKIKVTVNGMPSDEYAITVKSPNQLVRTNIQHSANATFGYRTEITYTIRDQFNSLIGAGSIPVNEDFTGTAVPDFSGTNWAITADKGFTASNPIISDIIEGENLTKNPTPQAPGNPLGSTKVVHWGQDIYVGSTTVGSGRKVQTATFQKYRDHADHENVTSPVP